MTTPTHPLTLTVALTSAVVLAACGSDAEGPADGSEGTPAPDTTEASPTIQPEPDDADLAADVAVCELLDTAEVSALLEDDLREPSPDEPTSYSLGACSWGAENNGRSLYVSARDLEQWDPALERDDFGVEPIEGLGERAWRTSDHGLFVDPGDRDYFYQLFVIGLDGDINFDLGVEAAELLLD